MKLILGEKIVEVEECKSFWKRFTGFMFRFKEIDKGLRFPKCSSIHTCFMFQPIDVIMTDKNGKVIKLYPNLPSEKFILPKRGVYYTYELPAGSISNLQVGDLIQVKEK